MCNKKPVLRQLEHSRRYFWRQSIDEQLSLKIHERDVNGKRLLSGNEILVMALNEMAAHRGRGFFFYLPPMRAHPTKSLLIPESRVPSPPGPDYPSLFYMDYSWTDQAQRGFYSESHRGRYLKCNALINPPPDATDIHCVQFINSLQPVYVTSNLSLVVYANETEFYLSTTTELDAILGRQRFNRATRAPHSDLIIAKTPYVWNKTLLLNPRNNRWDEEARIMERFKITSFEGLFEKITLQCGTVPPTMRASELRTTIPHPAYPEIGIPLGVSLNGLPEPASPRTTRGAPRKREKPTQEICEQLM
ncbi:hypothetical protein D6D12_02718 [Aureobasidium pullulans]|uniref:HNH nuclease domain-containing protein n=1 Tax=Aureobasidium pullulans TaxID=5580 RepID=A0AB74K142_AURPU|nr:hypothetical protein D6D12_02718 [Aureobasidium pullulans]THX45011.1 hypothetical protein D6D11_07719 [Aureobasidium pullulans]